MLMLSPNEVCNMCAGIGYGEYYDSVFEEIVTETCSKCHGSGRVVSNDLILRPRTDVVKTDAIEKAIAAVEAFRPRGIKL